MKIFQSKVLKYIVLLVTVLMLVVGSRAEAETIRVWIDTDPSCGHSATSDVDDCLAILQAVRSPALKIAGISTVFGNETGKITWETANDLLQRFDEDPAISDPLPLLFRGADKAGQEDSKGVQAIIEALEAGPLTVIAIGPLTNVAAVLKNRSDLANRVEKVVAVAGTRPGTRRLWPGNSRILHFHDLNFIKDVDAFDAVLTSGVPLHLMPFEAANQVTVTRRDMEELERTTGVAAWIAGESDGWIGFWEDRLDREGFSPFDSLAVGYLTAPGMFTCEIVPAKVVRRHGRFKTRSTLEVSDTYTDGIPVTFCNAVAGEYSNYLTSTLARTEGRTN
jgi:purine nucleosidase